MMRTIPTAAALLGSASVLCAGAAHAQVVRDVPSARAPADAPSRRVASQWSFDLRATYSDNFRRIDDERLRGVVFVPAEPDADDPALGVRRGQFLSEIETPDNVIFTVGARGGSVYQRPGLTAIIQGGIQAGTNLDNASLDERLADTPVPPDLTPNEDGSSFEGTTTALGFGLSQEQEFFVRPDLTASATARIVDELVYVDVAGIAQQQVISLRDAIQAEADGQLGDVTTFVGGSVSPYVNRQVAGNGTVEARLRASAVIVADEQFELLEGLGPDGEPLPARGDQRFANDSVSTEALVEYASGQLFDRVAFGLRASAARSEESGSDVQDEVELIRLTASGDARYDLGRNLAITAELGYDEVELEETDVGAADMEVTDGMDDGTGDDDPLPSTDVIDLAGRESDFSGVFWSVGAEYAPSTRSRLAVAVGERFGGLQVNGQLTYRPTPRLSVTGSAERVLGVGTQQGLQNAIGLNSRTLQIVEQLAQVQSGSARQLLDRAVGFQGGFSNIQQQQFGVQLRDVYRLSAAYTARRTDFGLAVSFDQSEFGEDTEARENERLAVQGSVQRTVTRRVRVGATARYDRLSGTLPVEAILAPGQAEQGADDDASEQVFVSANASYQVGPRLSITARAYRARSNGGGGGGFGIAREYEENAVSAGIRWTF